MHWIDWLILLMPLLGILYLAVYSRRYVRGVADFLAAGRVAGRYVISVGDLQAALAVFMLVALCEQQYQCGIGVTFWSQLSIPIGIFMSLTGYVFYRYRQTRALSLGQFLEMRYNRPFRIIAAAIRTLAEMISNAIGPAVTARFFIYLMGFPLTVTISGFEISTFTIVVTLVLTLAMIVIWPGGRVSLLVTDAIQGLMSYPIFVIFTVFVLSEVSWQNDVAPVMIDRAAGESFINPYDLAKLRDFNIFSIVVVTVNSILNRGAWIGNDTTGAGRTPHEQKMAGILGAWRSGFAYMMMALVALFLITVMQGNRFTDEAKDIRVELIDRVSRQTVADSEIREKIAQATNALPAMQRTSGIDEPFTQKNNADTPYLNMAENSLKQAAGSQIASQNIDSEGSEANQIKGQNNAVFQHFKTMYYQMMTPTVLRTKLPVGMMGIFVLLMVMMMVSTDDSRIFNASSTIVQDVVMPFRKKPFEKKEHLWWLRGMSIAVCVFFFFVSIFLSQMDYILMFIQIMCGLWLGAAGPIMIGGLYTRWGNTSGAFCALIFGSGMALIGLLCQLNWAEYIYPFLETHGYLGNVNSVFAFVNGKFAPIIEWKMSDTKFPINSFEISFIAMAMGCAAYAAGSLVTFRKPYNLDRMLHRCEYSDGGSIAKRSVWTWRNLSSRLIGIDNEYTLGDKVIAWSVFLYSVVFRFGIAFVAVALWNMFSPWPVEWWSWYFFIMIIVVGIIVGAVSTVWFLIGGIVDIRRLFKDLAARVDNPLDDGWVEGHVSLMDKAALGFDADDKDEDIA